MKIKYVLAALLICLTGGAVFSAPANKPDLTVSKIKIDSSRARENGKVVIIYTVKNMGKSKAALSHAKISVKPGEENVVCTQTVPALAPGSSYIGQAVCTVTSKKNYRFSITADYDNRIDESNKINNENSASFSFGKAF